jgi:uncharacterized protein
MNHAYCIKRSFATLITALCLSFASTMAIADVDKGIAAYEKQDYATALKEFKESAEQGDASAQFGLGLMYANGQGVVQNERAAIEWFQKAAEQGLSDAQYNLGVMYYFGQGVVKNMNTAYFWFLIANANGYDTKTFIELAEKKLTPTQKQAAQDDAANWRPKQ